MEDIKTKAINKVGLAYKKKTLSSLLLNDFSIFGKTVQ